MENKSKRLSWVSWEVGGHWATLSFSSSLGCRASLLICSLFQPFSEDGFPGVNFPACTLSKTDPKSQAVSWRLIHVSLEIFVSVLIGENLIGTSRVTWSQLIQSSAARRRSPWHSIVSAGTEGPLRGPWDRREDRDS